MWINRKLFICSIIATLFSSSHAEQFKMQNGVIKAKISYQNLNRIWVKGDKIDSILGVDTAFHVEKNEKTGEAFIRPTEDNGFTPISLSITTMSGKTQDLLLEPVEGEANSIELVLDTTAISEDFSQLLDSNLNAAVNENSSGTDYEETVSAVMKKFINLPNGDDARPNYPSVEVKGVVDRVHQHLKAKFESAYLIDGFLCLKFSVTTKKEGVFVLVERMFTQTGDVALSLSGLKIEKNGRATLYVLRK